MAAFAPAGVRDRFQWGSYGFVAGLLLGLILGVFFYGIVSFIIRYGLVALLLIPLVWAFFFWRSRQRGNDAGARTDGVAGGGRNGALVEVDVERGYVIEGQAKPVPEPRER